MYLQVYEIGSADDLQSLEWFVHLRGSAWGRGDAAKLVARIIDDVESEGDRAVERYMREWTDPEFSAKTIRVAPKELVDALRNLNRELREAMQKAIGQVRAYQQHIMPTDALPLTLGNAELGMRFTPVSSVGLLVPGGRAAYPSTVIMLAVPALVAGVAKDAISVVTPPPTRRAKGESDGEPGDVSPLVLAACALLGIDRVYRIGGAQGVAALASGTHSVKPVDMIVGPGNLYTQLAKMQVHGRVGIDGFYGPSEVLVIADDSANPVRVAADLIAQAEHDPGRCFLVAWSHKVIGQVNEQIDHQLTLRHRRKEIEAALKNGSAALLVTGEAEAVTVADQIAPEHVSLAVARPGDWLKRLRHGGAYFVGDSSPVAAGDYIAGPSHCLPTGTTARFASGVSVYTFLKRSGTVSYPKGIPTSLIDAAVCLAKAEGLDGHAASLRIRKRK